MKSNESAQMKMKPFTPLSWLRNAHAMTLAGALWPRPTPRLPRAEVRLFEVEAGTQLLAKCNWQKRARECPTLVMVHGLEGSSESGYVRGLAEMAFLAGFNAVRLNQRNCGGSERLTPTLYNSGLSGDYRSVLFELIECDKLPGIFFAGYSMGGNLVLKMAGELGAEAPAEFLGVCGVCPTIDLAVCVDALEAPGNRLYEWNFVLGLKRRLRRKGRLFPGRFLFDGLVKTVRGFDDVVTAPTFGFRDAAEYYDRSSAIRVTRRIAVPTLILTAQDDPFVPFAPFRTAEVSGNPCIEVVAPEFGGHCSFISAEGGMERRWAEARIVEFCRERAGKRDFPRRLPGR
jgi:predicted alpha/beta-fold hydrolase